MYAPWTIRRFGCSLVMMSYRRTDDTDPDVRSMRRLIVGLAVVAIAALGIYLFFWSGVFKFQPEEETFWHLLHQKGHWYLEIFISGVETILFDILIGLIGWRYVLKPYIAHRQAQAVAQDHELHGIEAHANEVEESGEQPVTRPLGAPGARAPMRDKRGTVERLSRSVRAPAFQAGGAGSIPVARSADPQPDFCPVRRSIQLVSMAA